MKLSDFNYHLPKNLIAQTPVEPRDSSKLLVLNKLTGKITDDYFYNLAHYLKPGDLIIRNNTKVIPARLFGNKTTGGKIEVLLIKKIKQTVNSEIWECLTKPGLKPEQKVMLNSLEAICLEKGKNKFTRILKFNQTGIKFLESLEKIGITPLPPYITNSKTDKKNRDNYQTIYAKYEGSSAAPTAGFHFTPELENKLTNKGIKIAEITLHVGLGTFLPVKTENIVEHKMHAEWFELNEQTAQLINQTKQEGGRVICVGTTSTRVLEASAIVEKNNDVVKAQIGETEIFMYPGYKFKICDGLITNFHLPQSTLLMLVSAFVSTPNTKKEFKNFKQSLIGKAYEHAIKNQYRFYSFGDGMIILP
jgi:S-adenosylmethionine:tRNA ribosyltransferase-isomerase